MSSLQGAKSFLQLAFTFLFCCFDFFTRGSKPASLVQSRKYIILGLKFENFSDIFKKIFWCFMCVKLKNLL